MPLSAATANPHAVVAPATPASASRWPSRRRASRQVHDPGHVPLRRVHRRRRGTLASTIGRGAARRLGPERLKGEGPFLPYGMIPTLSRPWASPAPRAWSTASAASRSWTGSAPSTTTRQPPPVDRLPPRTRSGRREGHPGPGHLRQQGPADRRLGLHLRRAAQRGGAAPGRGEVGLACARQVPFPVPGQPGRCPAPLQDGAGARAQPRPAQLRDPGTYPWTPGGYDRVRASRSGSPRSWTRPTGSWRAALTR